MAAAVVKVSDDLQCGLGVLDLTELATAGIRRQSLAYQPV
jgi:hypothetical protein